MIWNVTTKCGIANPVWHKTAIYHKIILSWITESYVLCKVDMFYYGIRLNRKIMSHIITLKSLSSTWYHKNVSKNPGLNPYSKLYHTLSYKCGEIQLNETLLGSSLKYLSSHGSFTDMRLLWPACEFWRKQTTPLVYSIRNQLLL